MKRVISLVLSIALALFSINISYAAGYTLPQRMLTQIRVGSGLTGSFVIHGNADSTRYPFLYAIQNAEYELRGMISEGYTRYHVFQNTDNNARQFPAEILKINDQYCFRTSFLDPGAYFVADTDQLIAMLLDLKAENPSILSGMLKLLYIDDTDEKKSADTSSLEKQVDLWISGFTPETNYVKNDDGSPSLTQTFSIPIESLYTTMTELIRYISQNDTAMNSLRNVFSGEQIELYFNPNLSYYYLEALANLDMTDHIVFSRTVSTLGDIIDNTLTLPLDEKKTGYSTVSIHNDKERKSIRISGPKGHYIIDLPLKSSLKENECSETYQFVRICPDSADKNLSLNIHLLKELEEHTNPEETVKYETEKYKVRMEQDASILPEDISAELIPEAEPLEISAEFQFSAISQIYSKPTTLDFSVAFVQGLYHYDISGSLVTVSPNSYNETNPWSVERPDTGSFINTDIFTKTDYKRLFDEWTKEAGIKIIKTPDEIMPSISE